jgi:hypothetical protein
MGMRILGPGGLEGRHGLVVSGPSHVLEAEKP